MTTSEPPVPAVAASQAFPFFAFGGSHRQIGEQHGEALREKVLQHPEMIYEQGRRVHANHVLSPELRRCEDAQPAELANSVSRQNRVTALIEAARGRATVDTLQEACRDHANAPDSIYAHPRFDGDEHTFASLIAAPAAGRMWVAKGPPCTHPYQAYEV